MLIRDELSGLLKAVYLPSPGRVREAQLLELFEGDGYVSRRIEAGLRAFSRCHVSLFGCKPEVLRELINGDGNGDDSTGKWARFLLELGRKKKYNALGQQTLSTIGCRQTYTCHLIPLLVPQPPGDGNYRSMLMKTSEALRLASSDTTVEWKWVIHRGLRKDRLPGGGDRY